MTKTKDIEYISHNPETGFWQIEGLEMLTEEETNSREYIMSIDVHSSFIHCPKRFEEILELQEKYREEDKLKEKNRKDA